MSTAFGPLADRPINPKVGLEIPHESAPLHVTGAALYTEDLVNRTKDVLHAWPLQAPRTTSWAWFGF
jgi:xanthine dehydrogenase large subunit